MRAWMQSMEKWFEEEKKSAERAQVCLDTLLTQVAEDAGATGPVVYVYDSAAHTLMVQDNDDSSYLFRIDCRVKTRESTDKDAEVYRILKQRQLDDAFRAP